MMHYFHEDQIHHVHHSLYHNHDTDRYSILVREDLLFMPDYLLFYCQCIICIRIHYSCLTILYLAEVSQVSFFILCLTIHPLPEDSILPIPFLLDGDPNISMLLQGFMCCKLIVQINFSYKNTLGACDFKSQAHTPSLLYLCLRQHICIAIIIFR